MQTERWRSCTEIFGAAVERRPNERAAFLEQRCAGDEVLRRKVELLLKYHEKSDGFIDSPAFEALPEFLLDDADALIGQHLGHYRIESVLGVGGMGVVYLAHDEQLGRNVALKLLPQSLVSNEAQLERLKREARIASALNHPNIVTIHEIGEVSGIHYIATEFIEGPTLRGRLAHGPIQPNEALEIAQQIASALSVAHDAGIVHCDIKPENVMLRPDGYVKVLDFGIAKFTQQETKSAGVEGTKRYMSPEQARGEELDARSDIWSLGVTLYEMVAGVVPFAELTSAVPPQMSGRHGGLSSSAGGTAAETSLRRRLRPEIDRMIDRMLAEKREARYQSAAELRADLQRVQRTLEASARPRWRLAAAAIAALALTAALCVKLFSPSPTLAPPLHEKSIAVLPFEDLSGEKENAFFANGVHDEILTNLAKVADLKVISRTSVMGFREKKRNLPEIARALGVAHVVEGSVQRAAGRVRVSAQLIDARTDTHLWAERYDGELADVFAIQSEIAQKIATQLKVALSPREQEAINTRPTADIAAYDLYLRAKDIWRRGPVHQPRETEEQVQLLDQAVARDPAFVPALCLLARAHLTSYWFYHDRTASRLELAKKALDAAARLQPDGGEVHLARAVFYYWGSRDYAPALAELALARRLLPNDADVLLYTGLIKRRQGRWEESTRHIEEATILDPRNANVFFHLVNGNYIPLRRYTDAARVLDRVLTWQPNDFLLEVVRARVDVFGQADLRRQKKLVTSEAAKTSPDTEMVARTRLQLALAQRDYQAAQEMLSAYRLTEFREFDFVTPREFYDGLVARGLGDLAKARTDFLTARERVAASVAQRPDDGRKVMILAQIDAHLGHKDDAIREGEHALELLPVAKDAFDGPMILVRLAGIYAQVGESARALDLLEQAAKLPNGPRYGLLKLDEVWDPLRGDPRFEKIVASLAPESAASEKRIAVLPFENLSSDKGDAFFADGMHDEILTNLAKIADLKVISRTSVMSFRDKKRNLPEIAEALGVAHVVEGSVQRTGDRVRVSAQLIDARTDTHLWAERYDRELTDIFAIQGNIAQQIANQLRAKLSPNEEAALRARPTQDMLAYDFYLRAKELERVVSGALPEKLNEKVLLLDQAVARDPAFVPALCLLARAHLEIYWFNLDHTAARLELASKALEAAARLEPEAGEVHLARAIGYYWGKRDYASALAELVHARRLLPNDADTLQFLAFIERRQGQWNESIRHLEEARTIDPRNAATSGELAFGYVSLRRYTDAARTFEEVLVWKPDDFTVQLGRALVDVEAKADLRRLQSIVFGESAKAGDAALLAAVRIRLPLWQRDYHAAEQALSRYPGPNIAERGYITPREFFTASILRGRGDPANAQTAFLAARERAAAMVAERPDDAKALIILAEVDARLGRKAEAIREGEEASKLLPVSKDAFDGPDILARLAGVLAQVGETRRALDLLEQVTNMPGAPSLTRPCYGRLKLDEVWDPLRGDPRFEKIVASLVPEPAAPEKSIAVLPSSILARPAIRNIFAMGFRRKF